MVAASFVAADLPGIGLQNALLTQSNLLGPVEVQGPWIPPHNPVPTGAGLVEPRRNRCAGSLASGFGALEDAVLPEPGAARRRSGVASQRGLRIHDGVEHVDPALHLFVAHDRNHQQIPRPGGRHVRQAHGLGRVAAQLFLGGIEKFASFKRLE